jgi:hypothetical protein
MRPGVGGHAPPSSSRSWLRTSGARAVCRGGRRGRRRFARGGPPFVVRTYHHASSSPAPLRARLRRTLREQGVRFATVGVSNRWCPGVAGPAMVRRPHLVSLLLGPPKLPVARPDDHCPPSAARLGGRRHARPGTETPSHPLRRGRGERRDRRLAGQQPRRRDSRHRLAPTPPIADEPAMTCLRTKRV